MYTDKELRHDCQKLLKLTKLLEQNIAIGFIEMNTINSTFDIDIKASLRTAISAIESVKHVKDIDLSIIVCNKCKTDLTRGVRHHNKGDIYCSSCYAKKAKEEDAK